MIRVLLIHPNDTTSVEAVEIEPDLAFFQGYVGGHIEATYAGLGHVMYVNEEGKIDGLQPNAIATALVRRAGVDDVIVGPAVVSGPGDAEGFDTSVTGEFIELVRSAGVEVVV